MTILQLLPSYIRQKIEHLPEVSKIVDNIGWLFFDKVLRMMSGLLVSVWLARYLGPDQLGRFNYALAFVGVFGAIAGLGLNGIVVRDIVRLPGMTNTTLGTAFFLQLIGSLFTLSLIISTITLFRPDDNIIRVMVVILSFGLVFKSTEVVKYWFESQVQSRYSIWIENVVFLVMSGIRIGMILNRAPLIAFAWSVFIESVLVAIGLIFIYLKKDGNLAKWVPNVKRAKSLLKDSWPLVLSNIAIVVYMRIDQVMLGNMLGNEEVGIYSVAQRVSEVWYFIPMVISASIFPSIVKSKEQSEASYYIKLQKTFNIIIVPAFLLALPLSYCSGSIVDLLFGPSYSTAGAILAVHVWTGVFVSLGVASSSWFLVENLPKYALYRTLNGAILNIVANFILIPIYGGVGAAISTLLSQLVAAYLSDLIRPETRFLFYMKTIALIPILRFFWKMDYVKPTI